MDIKEKKKKVYELINKYDKDRESYMNSIYNETQLRSDFLDPFFEILWWDIKNTSGKTTNEREVLLEEWLKESKFENSKKPDYTFRLFSERKFFLEAKKPSVKIDVNPDNAKQVRRYWFTAKLKISVLSNFEYLSIYDCSERVKESDSVNTALIKRYYYKDYGYKFEEIYKFLSQENVYLWIFDDTWLYIEDKISQFSVDDLFLKQINEWRLLLWNDIYNHQTDISEIELNDTVQSYINSIMFLRVCEDRNLEEYKELLSFASKEDFLALIKKFKEADKKYNSWLFTQKFTEKIISDNKSVFWTIIKNLYYPESPYSFSVFSSDILWNIYEIFLSEKLVILDDKIFLVKKPEHVDSDIITTPTNIIKDILRDTLIPFCRWKSDEEILNLKFADIACGSWAFLLEIFQLLNDILIDYYLQNNKKNIIQTSIDTYKLSFDIKKTLLLNCIHGIDKDYNAVQSCKFWLLLKILEWESNKTIPDTKPILPSLDNNILFWNSLLTPEQISPADTIEINPLELWDTKYDIIVGNPPYLKSEDMNNIYPKEVPLYSKNYESAFKQFDKYFLFIERGLSLLTQNWSLWFIVPSKFIKIWSWKNLRGLLQRTRSISKIISFWSNQIFKDKTTYTCLLFLNKKNQDNFKYLEIDDFKARKTRKISEYNFESVNTESLNSENRILMSWEFKRVFRKIESKSIPLGTLIWEENIFNWIQTSANKIYIHKATKEDSKYLYFEKDNKEWKIEKELTRPYFQTSNWNDNLYTYRKFQPNRFVIYPYVKKDRKIEFIDISDLENNYPFAHAYISFYKKELENERRDIKPKPKTQNEWYRYGRHQSLEKCEVPSKIVVGILSLWDKYAIDYNKTVLSSWWNAWYCAICIPEGCLYSIYYIQAVLNSKYVEWYCSLIGSQFRWWYISHGTQVLKRLPIVLIDFENIWEKNIHDEITRLQKELIDIQEEIDKNQHIPRFRMQFEQKFKNTKNILDHLLEELFLLWVDDKIISLTIRKRWN